MSRKDHKGVMSRDLRCAATLTSSRRGTLTSPLIGIYMNSICKQICVMLSYNVRFLILFDQKNVWALFHNIRVYQLVMFFRVFLSLKMYP